MNKMEKLTWKERKVNIKAALQIVYLKFFRFCKTKKNYRYKITLVCVLRDEASYVKEWIEYYKELGIEHFCFYDNKSKDNLTEILKPYIAENLVTYKYVDAENHPQGQSYTDAIFTFRNKSEYMLFVDIDEFICMRKQNLRFYDFAKSIYNTDRYIAGIGMNWLCYGSAGIKNKPNGLVIESYLNRSDSNYEANKHVKSLINPRKVYRGGAHVPFFYKNYYNVNENGERFKGPFNENPKYNNVSVNHYAAKSLEEQEIKAKKGFGKTKLKHCNHDINDVYDPIMLNIAKIIKQRME